MATDKIEIITDTTCDIPPLLAEQYRIQILPHIVIWNGKQYRDRVDIQPAEFYQRLDSDPALPSTAQISMQEFVEAYTCAKERGAREIVVLCVSGGLSGAIRAAEQAAQFVDIPVHAVDSKGVTMSLGFQVLAAARAREAGGDVSDLLAAAQRVRERVQLFVSMDTLEYVYRGGRIGNARRLVGSMLNVKPLVYIDHHSGIVEPSGISFTHHKVVELLVEKFFQQMDPSKPLHLAVMHGNVEAEARQLAARLNQEYHPVELVTNLTGPVLGIHTGPRAIALAGYSEG